MVNSSLTPLTKALGNPPVSRLIFIWSQCGQGKYIPFIFDISSLIEFIFIFFQKIHNILIWILMPIYTQ